MIETLLTSNGEYSMADILSMVPDFQDHIKRNKPISYDDFVEQINIDLNNIISNTESGKQHHFLKGEDEITEHIICQLKQLYPSVHHDAQQGGHCDIYIEVKNVRGELCKWVLEAKIWKGFEYVFSGLNEQLLKSYALGGVNNCNGGLMFYSKQKKGSKTIMDEWIEGLKKKSVYAINVRKDGLRFLTKHKLNSGHGSDYYVNHYCIDLFHEPTYLKHKRKDKRKVT